MCFVRISEQTAIISLYSIDWLTGFYNWDGVCLLRGTYQYLNITDVILTVPVLSHTNPRLFFVVSVHSAHVGQLFTSMNM